MKKHISRWFSLFFLALLWGGIVFFSKSAVVDATDYLDNGDEEYLYALTAEGVPQIDIDGADCLWAFEMTVQDPRTQEYLPSETLLFHLKGMPSQKETIIYQDPFVQQWATQEFNAVAGYKVNLVLPEIYHAQTWEEFVTAMIEEKASDVIQLNEGSFGGRQALVEEHKCLHSYADNRRTFIDSGCYWLYFQDIVIPNGIIVFKLDWQASSFAYNGYHDPAKKAAAEMLALDNYQLVLQAIKNRIEEYAAIPIITEKTSGVYIPQGSVEGDIPAVKEDVVHQEKAGGKTGFFSFILLLLLSTLATVMAIIFVRNRNDHETEMAENLFSRYQMVLEKNFGDTIQYNGEAVLLYVHMEEITSAGKKVICIDLTKQIEIYSENQFLEIVPVDSTDECNGVAVKAFSSGSLDMPREAVISFRFRGKGGLIQNNVQFKMTENCYIHLEKEKLYVLAGSQDVFTMPYKLANFANPPEVSLKVLQKDAPFSIQIGFDQKQSPVIIAQDQGLVKSAERFFQSFTCEIVAENGKERAQTVFYVVMCYEGVLVDFPDSGKEIKGYKNDVEEMEKTLFTVVQSIWNDELKRLELFKPENLTIKFSDSDNVFSIIGINYEESPEYAHTVAKGYYNLWANMALPFSERVKGKMRLENIVGKNIFVTETGVSLVPHFLQNCDRKEGEYQNCVEAINTYLPECYRENKLYELEKFFSILGCEDLRFFRHSCQTIAQRIIIQEKKGYLAESYWQGEEIILRELPHYLGEAAFAFVLPSLGKAGEDFVNYYVREAVMEMVAWYAQNPAGEFSKAEEFIENRFGALKGMADDDVLAIPEPGRAPLLKVWLARYTLKQIAHHWFFDLDELKQSRGIVEAIKNGLADFSEQRLSLVKKDLLSF